MIACGEVNNAKHLGLQSSHAIDNLLDVRNGLYLLQTAGLESVRHYGEVGQVPHLFPSSSVSHQPSVSN